VKIWKGACPDGTPRSSYCPPLDKSVNELTLYKPLRSGFVSGR